GLLHPVAASLVLLVSTRPLLILCATMARIQREQDADTRWTVRSHSWLLSGEFLAPALPDAAVARVVSAFSGRFEAFFSHSAFAVVFCSLSLISTLSRRTSECMNLIPPCSANVKFLVHQSFYFEFDNGIFTSTKII
ncbi:MAG TPA: hypothetical protein PLJ39_00550, partial [Spirochaetota bacterium]|nr:hypothetical protein [Spirochaetota bacterium]